MHEYRYKSEDIRKALQSREVIEYFYRQRHGHDRFTRHQVGCDLFDNQFKYSFLQFELFLVNEDIIL